MTRPFWAVLPFLTRTNCSTTSKHWKRGAQKFNSVATRRRRSAKPRHPLLLLLCQRLRSETSIDLSKDSRTHSAAQSDFCRHKLHSLPLGARAQTHGLCDSPCPGSRYQPGSNWSIAKYATALELRLVPTSRRSAIA